MKVAVLMGSVYLLLAIWSYAVVTWPILLDPLHDGEAIRPRLRLGLQVLLTHPMRVLAVIKDIEKRATKVSSTRTLPRGGTAPRM